MGQPGQGVEGTRFAFGQWFRSFCRVVGVCCYYMGDLYCRFWVFVLARFSYSRDLDSLVVARAVYLPLRVDDKVGHILEEVSC